jgi:alcohol dehydrogenase class IV
MVLPEVLAAYGECVHPRLADLARLVGIGESGDTDRQLAGAFIDAIIDMRKEMELPLRPKDLKAHDVPGIIDEALKEAGGLYPVPRYMTADEVRHIVNRLLPA